MIRNFSKILLVLLSLLLFNNATIPGNRTFETPLVDEPLDPPFLQADSAWVDSVMLGMSLDEKIAQMLMIQAYSNRDEAHTRELEKLIRKHKVGGVIFFQGSPGRQAHMTNRFQGTSEIPLLIAMDGEWGLGMRLDSVISYPKQMMLGAISNDSLIYMMGKDIAEQMRTLGVHMNFAPVADINNNPRNPVINTRSFGEERVNVSEKVIAYFSGMQDHGLLVTAKHFPGHGDTDSDSHKTLPLISHSYDRLDSIELYPFRKAIDKGLTGIMVAHLHVPVLDSTENRATTLSKQVVTDLLQDEMRFKGLIVTDALNMKGVSAYFKPGQINVEAVKAGNDILLMPDDVSKAISSIKRAVKRDIIPETQIDQQCRKILMAKSWLGLQLQQRVETADLYERLNDRKFLLLQQQLIENALTLLKNDNDVLPLSGLGTMDLATLNIGVEEETSFTKALDLYLGGDHYFFNDLAYFPLVDEVSKGLIRYSTLVINIHKTKTQGAGFGITDETKEFLDSLDFDGQVILNVFGYPYALGELNSLERYDAILVSYSESSLNQQFAAQGIFGAISFSGTIPVAAGSHYPAGAGINTTGSTRLKYTVPESAGMSYDTLLLIDNIVSEAIKAKAIPGCQVLVARRGEVVWNKSYGYHTYRNRIKVTNDDIYDLASLTKICATVPSLMHLQDQGVFSVDSTLGTYLPWIDTSNKDGLIIKDILTHRAGLSSWIPFYQSTLETLDSSQSLFSNNFNYTYPIKLGGGSFANRNIVYKENVYARSYSQAYSNEVARDLFINNAYEDSIYNAILDSPLNGKEYKYSDLGYYFLFQAVEYLTDTLFYPYNWFNFYGPLGAETLGYLPLKRFNSKRIVPTENDIIFRKQLLRGYVHDPGAAMLGGVAGHAGLFSSANDLAKMMQMYLNNGVYGGKRFLDSATIAQYTSCQFEEEHNRRGLGFDRPIVFEDNAGPACDSASASSYGHTGFTGTIAWMDPEADLLFIFLSNRIHPNQANLKLIEMDVRTDIQQLLYQAIED